jgi:hypothetical protein
MISSRQTATSLGKRFAASACLLAVLLVWSPLWAAAVEASGMSCCAGGMCAAHGHTRQNHEVQVQHEPAQSPMNCEHHGRSGLASCAMSCCPESSHSYTASISFILPVPVIICVPVHKVAAPATLASTESLLTFKPLAPPPRTAPLFR